MSRIRKPQRRSNADIGMRLLVGCIVILITTELVALIVWGKIL